MTDPQSQAFSGAEAEDWDETPLLDHPHSTLDDLAPDGPTRTREQHERDGWDAGRAGPKTLDEARENLAARIRDPACPDTDAEAGAYDEQG